MPANRASRAEVVPTEGRARDAQRRYGCTSRVSSGSILMSKAATPRLLCSIPAAESRHRQPGRAKRHCWHGMQRMCRHRVMTPAAYAVHSLSNDPFGLRYRRSNPCGCDGCTPAGAVHLSIAQGERNTSRTNKKWNDIAMPPAAVCWVTGGVTPTHSACPSRPQRWRTARCKSR